MWRCTRCGSEVEDNFEICWNCNAEKADGQYVRNAVPETKQFESETNAVMHEEYKVVTLGTHISSFNSLTEIGKRMDVCINSEAAAGWEYVGCENVNATIGGSNGCFGVGAKPVASASVMVLVFKR